MKRFSKPSEAQTKLSEAQTKPIKIILVTSYFCVMSLLTLTCIIITIVDHRDAQTLKSPTWYLLLVVEHSRFQVNALKWP